MFFNKKEKSSVIIGQRIKKTNDNPYGFQHVDVISYNKPAVLFLSGSGTESTFKGVDQCANGYLSRVEKALMSNGITNIDLFAVIYNYGVGSERFEDYLARTKLFADHFVPYGDPKYKTIGNKRGYFKENKFVRMFYLSEDTLHPKYVDDLMDKAFLLRLCDEKGMKIPVEEAMKRMRRLTVVAHCHGAYTFLKLEERLQEKMKELGYSNKERFEIQKQLLCVAYAPEAPLGISKSTMISFFSCRDEMTDFNNNFKKALTGKIIKPSYFPGKQGELFLINSNYDPMLGPLVSEHQGILDYDNRDSLTKDGKHLLTFFANAIANGVKSSIDDVLLPSVEDLVCGHDKMRKILFKQFKQNGMDLWNEITQETKKRLQALHNKNRG